ncbi:MAG: hypothetical protein VCF24_10545 [Candidatus Latescibacterota bacterium]
MVIHRIIGLCYLVLYLLLMAQMVPRVFDYQVEFSTRTVAHLMLGVSIGLLLIVKLSIIRFFKHFSGVVPYLGCTLLWCTTMVVSLSVPFAFKASYWSQAAVGGAVRGCPAAYRPRRAADPVCHLPRSEDDPDEAAHARGLGAHGGTYGQSADLRAD